MKDKMKPNFGNWVPKKLLALLFITTLAIAILLCLAVFLDWLMPITYTLAVLLCISLFFSCYMMAFHHAFSFDGGGMTLSSVALYRYRLLGYPHVEKLHAPKNEGVEIVAANAAPKNLL